MVFAVIHIGGDLRSPRTDSTECCCAVFAFVLIKLAAKAWFGMRKSSYWPKTRLTLLNRLQASSDNSSWNEFVTLYGPPINRFCRYRLNENAAADVSQQVFLRLFKSLPTFSYNPSKGSFGGWIGKVTRNELIKFAVGEKKHAGVQELVDIMSHNAEATWYDILNQHVMEIALHRAKRSVRALDWERSWKSTEKIKDIAQSLNITDTRLYKARFAVSKKLREIIYEICSDYPFSVDVPSNPSVDSNQN
jgi:DNA-directed RNA polymerase specialized sigma24 family protein